MPTTSPPGCAREGPPRDWRDGPPGTAAVPPRRVRARRPGGAEGLDHDLGLPAAQDEGHTIGGIVTAIRRPLVEVRPLVDEIIVVDDRSSDDTAAAAAAAGATVVSTAEPFGELPLGTGKGEALWRGLAASTGDLVVFCDADITDFDTRFIVGLVGPLLVDPTVLFVKGFYERPDTHAPGRAGARRSSSPAR